MKAEIITIGDEILIGQIVDTNSEFIAKELNKIGVSVYQISSIQDKEAHIINAIKEAESRADIIIITGGLGPTKDDVTKHTLCTYFNDVLQQNNTVLAHVTTLLTNKNIPVTEINKQQALVPSKAVILNNEYGTAPGMYFTKNTKTIVSLPGVPYEMKSIIVNEVIPKLVKKYKTPYILHKTIVTQGLPESVLAATISDWENQLPNHIKLAYLPSSGIVKLRLSAIGNIKTELEQQIEIEVSKVLQKIGNNVLGYDEVLPAQVLKEMFLTQQKTLALAESCTGGAIAVAITQQEGVSGFFKGGMVTYQTETKTSVLGVSQEIISKNTVVSEAVAYQMALEAQQKFASDYAIATTGNAGPTKGDSDAAIGTVYIAIATPDKVIVQNFNFGTDRKRVIERTKNKAFEMLRKELMMAQE